MNELAILGGSPVTTDLVVNGSLRRSRDLERRYLLDAFDSEAWDGWYTADSHAMRFESEFAQFSTSEHCALVTNGTHALQVALETLGVGYGDEVIVPGLTWQATASVVCDVNAVPVLVDVDPQTFCIDPEQVEQAITDNTRAIIAVHLYHRMADVGRLAAIAERHGVRLIEDCAHSHGSCWDGRGAGTFGALGTYSFQSSKLMSCAEGGAILCQDAELHDRVLSQRACGRPGTNGQRVHNGNYRLTSLQAAILRGQLDAFRHNADVIDTNGLALDAAVDAAPGVSALRRDPAATRLCGYMFGFRYEPDAYDGMDVELFRRALGAEVGVNFGSTYEPLNDSPLYYPHTKPRHQLSDGYLEAIRPSRWQLPVATELYRRRAVMATWQTFACPPAHASRLTDAIAKVYEHRSRLLTDGASIVAAGGAA